MHDIRALRENPELYEKAWTAKGRSGAAGEAVELDAQLRATQSELQLLQAKLNELAKDIGKARAQKDEATASVLIAEAAGLKTQPGALSGRENGIKQALQNLLAALPNLPAPDVPPGADETQNVEIRRWGQPDAIPNPKDHVDLGERLKMRCPLYWRHPGAGNRAPRNLRAKRCRRATRMSMSFALPWRLTLPICNCTGNWPTCCSP